MDAEVKFDVVVAESQTQHISQALPILYEIPNDVIYKV